MAFSDGFFKKVEKKTNVDKQTILSLASKLQGSNMKNEDTLKEVIQDIAKITGREVSPEKEKKIIDTVLNDGVPKDLNKYFRFQSAEKSKDQSKTTQHSAVQTAIARRMSGRG